MKVNQKYGYVRVSSKSQQDNSSIEGQKQELIRNGIPKKNLRVEVGSAVDSIQNRPKFQHLIQNKLQENDLVMVTMLDRCSRNTLEFLKLQDTLFKRNITFVALDLPNSLDLATNRLIATTLSGIAEFENNRRKERQRQGIQAAKQAGKYKGRKSVINKALITKVKDLKENKKMSVTEIAQLTGKSRPTVYKILKQELGYVSNRLVKSVNQEETHASK